MDNRLKKIVAFIIVIFMFLNISIGVYADAIRPDQEEENVRSTQRELEDEENETQEEKSQEATETILEEKHEQSTKEAEETKEIENVEEVKEEEIKEEESEEQEEVKEQETEKSEVGKESNKEEDKENLEEDLDQEEGPVLLTSRVNGVQITVSAASGVLSKDTSLNVQAVSNETSQSFKNSINKSSNTNLDKLIAFDITLLDKDGNEVQPDGDVRVSFSGINFVKDNKDTIVYYLGSSSSKMQRSNFGARSSQGQSASVREISSQAGNASVSFTTKHFSIYGVGTKAVASYNFYVGTDLKDTQMVLDGERLEEPATPADQAGKRFTGWYLEGATNPIDFNNTVTVNTSETKKVEARFDHVFYVYFVYDENIIKTKEVGPGTTTDANNIALVVLEDGKALDHWSETENGTAFDFTSPITGDTTLHAVLADKWKVEFDSQGGNTLLPKYIPNGASLGTVSAPVKAGYEFKRWNTQADGGGTNYTNATLTINNTTITHPTRYSFTAKFESNISDLWPTASNIPDKGSYKFYGWDTSGSTSKQVSKVLKLTSDYVSTSGTKVFTGDWSTSLSKYTLHYMIERLAEESALPGDKKFGNKWYREDPAYSQTANSQGNWNAKQLPGVTNVGKKSESGKNEYFFYDRNSYDLDYFNPTSQLDQTYNLKYGSSITSKSYIPLRPTGVSSDYVFMGWFTDPDGAGNQFDFTNKTMPENNLALYSKWAPPEYSVGYYKTQDGDGPLQTIDGIPGGDTISESQLSKTIPEGLDEVEDFAGWYWYLDGTFVPYDFNTPVINNDYVLYPVWKDLEYKVTYNSGGGSGTVPEDSNEYKLGAGANVLSPDNLIPPSGKVFLGRRIYINSNLSCNSRRYEC